MDPETLIRLMSERGWIDSKDVDRLLDDYDSSGQDLFDFLEASGVGSKQEVLKEVAEFKGTEIVDLKTVEFPPPLLDAIPDDLVRIYRCIPIHDSTDELKICLYDPLDDAAVVELEKLLGRHIKVVIADPDDVEDRVQQRLSGSSISSPSAKSAPVFASLGVKADADHDAQRYSRRSGIRMVSLALLAASTTAVAALYMGQQHSAQAAKTLLEEFKAFQESHRLSRLTWEQEVREIELEIEKLGSLLDRSEVDAIKLSQLEDGMRRLEGKIEALREIKSPPKSGEGSEQVEDGVREQP